MHEDQVVDVDAGKAQTVDYDWPLAVDVRVKHAASLPRQHLQIQHTPFPSRELLPVVLLRVNALFFSPVLANALKSRISPSFRPLLLFLSPDRMQQIWTTLLSDETIQNALSNLIGYLGCLKSSPLWKKPTVLLSQ